MNYQLCKEFPAFTPFAIDSERFHTVVKLYSNVRQMQIREEKREKRKQKQKDIIRRPASDNWF